MAFVRTKTRNGKQRHHLVENYRKDGKVRQRTIAYLGEYPTVEVAIEQLVPEIQRRRQRAESSRRKAEELRQRMHPNWIASNGGEVPRPRREGLSTANKLFGRYWSALNYASSNDYWADKRQRQLDRLCAHVRSDHKLLYESQVVGTTSEVQLPATQQSKTGSDHKLFDGPQVVGTTPKVPA